MAASTLAAPTAAPQTYSRREQVGWYFYDWANSAFSTTVVSVFLGPYLTAITQAAADADGFVYPLGHCPINADSFFPYMVSLSVVLQVFFLPVLGAIADYTHLKKRLLGDLRLYRRACHHGHVLPAGRQLPAGRRPLPDCQPRVSAPPWSSTTPTCPTLPAPTSATRCRRRGGRWATWAAGLLLLLNLVFLQVLAEPLGVSTGDAVRICLASAGDLVGRIFTLIPLQRLASHQARKALAQGETYLGVGFKQLGHTLRQAAQATRRRSSFWWPTCSTTTASRR